MAWGLLESQCAEACGPELWMVGETGSFQSYWGVSSRFRQQTIINLDHCKLNLWVTTTSRIA